MIIRRNSIIASIFLLFTNLFIITFFFSTVHVIGQIFYTIVLSGLMYLTMRVKEIRKRGFKTFLLVLTIQIVVFGSFYFANFHRLNVGERIYFMKYDEVEYSMGREHFWYSSYYHHSQGSDTLVNYLYIYPYHEKEGFENEPDLYIYDLTKELWNMEQKLDTNGEQVVNVFRLEPSTWYVTHTEEDDTLYTRIYQIFEDELDSELMHQYEGHLDVFGGVEDIIVLTYDSASSETIINYVSGFDQLAEKGRILHEITNIHAYGDRIYVEMWHSSLDLVLRSYDKNFENRGNIIEGLHDEAVYTTGFDKLLFYDEQVTYVYSPVDGYMFEIESPIHYDGESMYLGNEYNYDLDFKRTGEYLYIDRQGYVAGENRAYLTRYGNMIVFNNEKLVELMPIGIEPSIFIPGYARHVLGALAVLIGSVIYTAGLRKPKVHIAKSHIYQVKKMTCKVCGADNNIVTFPHNCDYCHSNEFKTKI